MLGFKLLTGAFPDLGVDETYNQTRAPSLLTENSSGWLDAVLLKCISTDPAERYPSAGAVLTAINDWRENEAQKELSPAVVGSNFPRRGHAVGSEAVPIALGHRMGEEKRLPEPQEPPKPEKRVIGSIGAISFLGIVGAIAWIFWGGVLYPNYEIAGDRIRVAPGDIDLDQGDDTTGTGAKVQYVTKLASSDDPLAHDALIQELKEAQSKEFSDFVWKAILDRARRLGVQRGSDQLRAWGKSQGDDFKPVSLEGLLRCLDVAYPDVERQAVLREQYPKFPKLIMRFTAALALDLAKPEQFKELLAMMAQETEQVTDGSARSSLTLMMLLPDVNTIFLDDIASSVSLIPDEDLKWVLGELAKRGNPQMPRVADIALSRKLIIPPFTSFLEVLRRKTMIPQPVMVALVHGALGQLSTQDGSVLSNWLDQDSFPALAATILTTSDSAIKQTALEAMLTKPTPNRTIQKLIDFGKTNYREDVGRLADIISALALEEQLGNLDLDRKFSGIDALPKGREILAIMLLSESNRVVMSLIKNYPNAITSAAYLDLLTHREKGIRILAVENLRTSNDIVVLKIILDSYNAETDGDVKAAYEKHLSVIKERRTK